MLLQGLDGHINPGLAIAAKIKEKQPKSEILFIGTESGLEQDLVPRAGFKLKTVEAYGFNRKLSLKNIAHIIKTFLSIGDAKKILKNFKPDVVIGTGGYICMPVIMAAKRLKIKTILHESNAFPGASVRMLSKKVDRVLLGFKEAASRLPNAKTADTGTPTKIKKLYFSQKQKEEKLEELGLSPKKPLVLAFGGSQGAKIINETLIDVIKSQSNADYQIMWACGQTQYDQIKDSVQGIKNAKVVPYIYNMEEVLNLCDVVVARSGAMTITEISTVGKPAIFIPLAIATENHQEYNAKVLADVGAAIIIKENQLKKEVLAQAIDKMIKLTVEERKQIEEKARKGCMPNASEKIYQEIMTVLSEK